MKFIEIACSACDTEYSLEYNEDDSIGKPTICPFCGEELEDSNEDLDEDLDEEDE